jgi:hypothetical protein
MSTVCSYTHAQMTTLRDTHPVTRTEILKELLELRSVGYDPADENYPGSLQAAQRKLDEKRRTEATDAPRGLQPGQPGPAR